VRVGVMSDRHGSSLAPDAVIADGAHHRVVPRMSRRGSCRGAVSAALVAWVLLTSCSSDPQAVEQPPGSSTTSSTSAAPAPSTDRPDCPNRPAGSSRARFDADGGTYAAQAIGVADRRRLRFDIVQWLTGEQANAAYLRESGDSSGAPNDYFIVNERHGVRTAPVSEEASILVLRADGYAGTLHEVPLAALPTDEPDRMFWLTFEDGSVTAICQQYRP
jgi:hypothetical protein